MKVFEYLVVGSGCAGAMAAQTLVEGGVPVTMLDAGEEDIKYASLIPNKDFISIRRNDVNQYQYFIGDNLEGIAAAELGKGAQITPPRHHMVRSVNSYLPISSNTFSPLESLGYGGLGIAWGLQCWEFSSADLDRVGLDKDRMRQAYELVSKRIGISATKDDAAKYTLGNLKTFQPSAIMDRNHQLIYEKYNSKKELLQKKGFFLGRTPLALLTKDQEDRKAYSYKGMDFYADNEQSAWRPWITVNQLKHHKNFLYIGGYVVTSFSEAKNYIEVTCKEITNNSIKIFRCRRLLLATGTLGSARIALRSFKDKNIKLPLLSNPYTYIPCLQPAMVGKGIELRKLGFAQLSLFYDPKGDNFDDSVASLYSYQSLMMLRIIRQLPLNYKDTRTLLRYGMSGLVIMGVHHPDSMSDQKYVQLIDDKTTTTGDKLTATYILDTADRTMQSAREKKFMKVMRRMGTYPIKRINPGNGASVHYAGTLPFSREEKPYTLAPNGQLHGTKHVYVADSSGFKYLPAKGLTFSLLANAHLIAENVLQHG